jgi:hypothetical protein
MKIKNKSGSNAKTNDAQGLNCAVSACFMRSCDANTNFGPVTPCRLHLLAAVLHLPQLPLPPQQCRRSAI